MLPHDLLHSLWPFAAGFPAASGFFLPISVALIVLPVLG